MGTLSSRDCGPGFCLPAKTLSELEGDSTSVGREKEGAAGAEDWEGDSASAGSENDNEEAGAAGAMELERGSSSAEREKVGAGAAPSPAGASVDVEGDSALADPERERRQRGLRSWRKSPRRRGLRRRVKRGAAFGELEGGSRRPGVRGRVMHGCSAARGGFGWGAEGVHGGG
jgi:hypothetical protein